MGTPPLPSPSVPGQHGACRVGARPLPRPPSAGGGDRGSGTRPPPLRWSQVSIDGIAAAQPAASAKSGVENGGRRRECDPGPPGPGSEVVGPRAGRRARARRRRRAQPWRGEDDRTRGERGEGDQGSEPGPRGPTCGAARCGPRAG